MADNKQYYYLKLKDNFFDTDAMIILESMENGYLYSNILMKMYLRSIKTDGKLMFNERIPYNTQMLAKIVRHNVDVVEKAIKLFVELGLIEILDNGAIYMLDIQNYIGKSSTEADRQRAYYNKIKDEKNNTKLLEENNACKKSCKNSTPEIEIEIEKEIEINNNTKTKHKYGEYHHVLLTDSDLDKLKQEFPTKWEQLIKNLDEGIELKGYKYKSHYLAIKKWAAKDQEQHTPIIKEKTTEERLKEVFGDETI